MLHTQRPRRPAGTGAGPCAPSPGGPPRSRRSPTLSALSQPRLCSHHPRDVPCLSGPVRAHRSTVRGRGSRRDRNRAALVRERLRRQGRCRLIIRPGQRRDRWSAARGGPGAAESVGPGVMIRSRLRNSRGGRDAGRLPRSAGEFLGSFWAGCRSKIPNGNHWQHNPCSADAHTDTDTARAEYAGRCRRTYRQGDCEEVHMQLGKAGSLILRLVAAKFSPGYSAG